MCAEFYDVVEAVAFWNTLDPCTELPLRPIPRPLFRRRCCFEKLRRDEVDRFESLERVKGGEANPARKALPPCRDPSRRSDAVRLAVLLESRFRVAKSLNSAEW